MRIEGEIYIGEASPWAGRAMRPFTGGYGLQFAAMGIILAGVLIGVVLFAVIKAGLSMPGWSWAPFALLLFVAVNIAAVRVCRTLTVRRFKDALAERGTPNPLPHALEIDAAGVRVISGETEMKTSWSALSEARRIGPYWVLIAQAMPYYVPVRMLPDEGEFLKALSQYMTTQALARSDEPLRKMRPDRVD